MAIKTDMKIVLKVMRWLAVALACVLIILQFIRPAKTNPAVDETRTIEAHTQMTPQVAALLARSCNDCHSNKTVWPWYSHVAPISWYLIDHVNHGRQELNFSEWAEYDREEAEELLEEICGEVKQGAMPLRSYVRLHRGAAFSSADVKTICDWTGVEIKRLGEKSEEKTALK